MKKAVVTVLGQDKVGITAKICGVLAETNINILDISQTIQDGIFSMVLICDMEKASVSLKEFQDKMAQEGKKMGVDARVQLADLFYAMHRI